MARIITYSMLLAGMLILTTLAGISVSSNAILTALGWTPIGGLSTTTSSTFYITIIGIFAGATVIGAIAGLFTKQSIESFMIAGLSSFLLTWGTTDMIGLYLTIKNTCGVGASCSWAANIILLLIVPLLVGFFISMIQWWRGNDI